MKKLIYLFLLTVVAVLISCKREAIYVEEGELTFSDAVINFDTLFTGFESPTGRVMVYNNTDHNVLVSEISLEKGSASDFSLVIDGIESNSVKDLEILEGDSVLVLIKYASDVKDDYANDRIIFRVGSWTGNVEIQGFALNAIFLKDTVFYGQRSLDPSKKYVIDGVLLVAPDAVLNIPAGTHLYFTPRKDEDFNFISRLEVWGTLNAMGSKGNEVVFQQTRFGEDYEETAGQWRGLRFYSPSTNSKMTHSLVKNAVIGIEVDSVTNGNNKKLILDRCEIRNCAAYGILGLGFLAVTVPYAGDNRMIDAECCLIQNCKEGTFYAFGGGWYVFRNCTFANYTLDFIRNAPQIGLSNYYEDFGLSYYCKANFKNCIVWGSEEEEVVVDTSSLTGLFDVYFDTCMVRSNEVPLKGSNIIKSQSDNYPGFLDPYDGDPQDRSYRLTAHSPAKDAGAYLGFIPLDLDDWYRPTNPPYDLGCYEYH